METIKYRGLRSSFILYVLITFAVVKVLSGLTIWGCMTLQKTLLPDTDLVYLTIQKSDPNGNETTTTVPMSLNDVLKEIPSMISMEDTDGDILSVDQNVKFCCYPRLQNRSRTKTWIFRFLIQAPMKWARCALLLSK